MAAPTRRNSSNRNLRCAAWLAAGLAVTLGLPAGRAMAEENTVAPSAQAEKATPEVIDALITQLRSDESSERDTARKKLAAIGEPVRAPLTKALDAPGGDLDFKAQATQILKALDQIDVLRGIDNPKTIDLDLKDAKVADALASLEKHFGWKVEASEEAAAKTVSFAVQSASFFQALEAIRTAARLGYASDASVSDKPGRLPFTIVDLGEKGVAAAAASGPYLVFLSRITANINRTLDLSAGEPTEKRTYAFEARVVGEPNLPVSSLNLNESLFQFGKDGEAKSTYRQMQPLGEGVKDCASMYTINEHPTLDTEAKTIRWKLQVQADVALKIDEKRIDDLSDGKDRTLKVGDSTIKVTGVKEKNNRWELTYAASGDIVQDLTGRRGRSQAGMAIMARNGMVFGGRGAANAGKPPENKPGLFFLDAEGNQIQNTGYSMHSSNNNELNATATLSTEPKGVLFRAVEQKAERTFDLEIKDVPLP